MRRVGHAIGDYRLTDAGDRILVAVSGGRKSFVLLHMLDLHRRRFPYSFEPRYQEKKRMINGYLAKWLALHLGTSPRQLETGVF